MTTEPHQCGRRESHPTHPTPLPPHTDRPPRPARAPPPPPPPPTCSRQRYSRAQARWYEARHVRLKHPSVAPFLRHAGWGGAVGGGNGVVRCGAWVVVGAPAAISPTKSPGPPPCTALHCQGRTHSLQSLQRSMRPRRTASRMPSSWLLPLRRHQQQQRERLEAAATMAAGLVLTTTPLPPQSAPLLSSLTLGRTLRGSSGRTGRAPKRGPPLQGGRRQGPGGGQGGEARPTGGKGGEKARLPQG